MKDKIVFWVDGLALSFCLSYFLQKKTQCDAFAIIDVTDRQKSFFEKQNLTNFTECIFYHDHINRNQKTPDLLYLKNFELKYNIPLWKLAHNERLFYRYNDYHNFTDTEILCILEQECKLFENFLDKINPDFLIIKTTDLHHTHLFYQLCRSKKIRILMFDQTRLGYKSIITEERDKLDYFNKDELNKIECTIKSFPELREYLTKYNLSTQLNSYINSFRSSKFEKIKSAFQFLFISKNTNIDTHYSYYGRSKIKVLFKEIIAAIKTQFREYYINKNFVREIEHGQEYIYFPLHQEPERVLLLANPYYTNQLETVRHIAKSIPVGYTLLVKEHPTMKIRGWHSIKYYNEMQEIPNVKLIHPSVSSEELIKKSSLVISVGGTASFEAVFYQKPSIVFADVEYAVLHSVHKLNYLEELPNAIINSLKKTVEPNDLSKYIALLESNSFEFDLIGFSSECVNYFYFCGNLADVEISPQKVEEFIHVHETKLENLTEQFIKKINQHKSRRNK